MAAFNPQGVKAENLPKTRREQFKIIFKNEFFTLFILGAILLLTSLPMIAFIFLKQQVSVNITQAAIDAGKSNEDFIFNDMITNLIGCVVMLVPLAILALGFSGCYRVLRNIIFNDGVLFRYDFKKGIAQNFKTTFISFAIADGLLLLCYFIKFLVYFYCSIKFAYFVSNVLIVLFVFHILVELAYLALNCFYNNKVTSGLTFSFFLVLRKFPVNLIFGAIIGVFYIFIISSDILVDAIVLFLSILVILPFFLLTNLMYFTSVFDKDYNESRKEIQYKGLYK